MDRFEFDICVPAAHPAMPGHFPGEPIVPGVLLIDHVLTELLRLTGMELILLKHVKFSSVLLPDEPVHVVCDVDGEQATFLASSTQIIKNKIFANGKILMQVKCHESLDS